jgi:putative flippase GtrA
MPHQLLQHYLLAQLFATAVVLVRNFFAHLLWSFAAD